MKNKFVISLLKELIQTNKTRIYIYKEAYKDTKYNDLKRSFIKYIATSKKINRELIQIIYSFGGNTIIQNPINKYLLIIYMKLNMVFFNYGRKAILDFCVYCDFKMKKKYFFVLKKKNSNYLSFRNQKIIKEQQKQITKESTEVSSFRDKSV